MSGGYFNDYGYVYEGVKKFAKELEREINRNGKDPDSDYAFNFSPKVINRLKIQVRNLRLMAEIMMDIDYLYSGDSLEEDFLMNMSDRDDYLYKMIWNVVADKLGDTVDSDELTDRILDALNEPWE